MTGAAPRALGGFSRRPTWASAAVLLMTLSSVFAAGQGAAAELAGAMRYESRYATVTSGQWEALDGPGTRFGSPVAFLDEVDAYVVLISSYLGRTAWRDRYGGTGKIEFFHEPDGYCHVEGGYYHFESPVLRVHLNGSFRSDRAPLAHEITHLILPEYGSLSLREGLASEIQDRFGRNISLYSLGADVHSLSVRFLAGSSGHVVDAVGQPGIPGIDLMGDEEVRAAFYVLSHSFSKYLLDRLGTEAFLRLYESRDLAAEYHAVTGSGLEALKAEWRGFIAHGRTPARHVASTGEAAGEGQGAQVDDGTEPGRQPGAL